MPGQSTKSLDHCEAKISIETCLLAVQMKNESLTTKLLLKLAIYHPLNQKFNQLFFSSRTTFCRTGLISIVQIKSNGPARFRMGIIENELYGIDLPGVEWSNDFLPNSPPIASFSPFKVSAGTTQINSQCPSSVARYISARLTGRKSGGRYILGKREDAADLTYHPS